MPLKNPVPVVLNGLIKITFLQIDKLAAHGLDGCTPHWIKNWLNG